MQNKLTYSKSASKSVNKQVISNIAHKARELDCVAEDNLEDIAYIYNFKTCLLIIFICVK